MSKKCTRCGETKPITAFGRRVNHARVRSHCKACESADTRDRVLKAFPWGAAAEWATPTQQRAVDALVAHGSVIKAAKAEGMTAGELRDALSELKRASARRGWSPAQDMTKTVPAGFHVKGVSTYYDRYGEPRGQWVKSNKDQEHRAALLLDAVQRIAEPFKGLAKPAKGPKRFDKDLLCVYPMGDPHVGMHAWAEECGQSFDLKIAEKSLVAAVDHLVGLAPSAEHALIINLGDFFHADSALARTKSGHQLDVDSRWAKVLAIGIRIMRRCIDQALAKHKHVTVICEIGNHDDHSAIMLALCLQQYYEREKRVTIDTSPAKFHWHRFGKVLIGVTHGDTCKPDKLPGVMACDRASDWGETEHRYWYTGHVHHDSAKEYPGVIVETFRTLAPKDAWHAAAGYRSGQDMKCDVIHAEWGRINRHTVGIRQVWGDK